MKRLFMMLMLSVGLFTAHAQQTLSASKTSMTAADTAYLSAKIDGYNDYLSFQLVQTKTSGTVAGYAFLQGSVDGTNYETVVGTDSITFSNQATNTKIWKLTGSWYTYYRIKTITSGTNVTVPTGFYLNRRR